MTEDGNEEAGTAQYENPLDRVFEVFVAAERRHAIRVLEGRDEPLAVADLAHEIASRGIEPPEAVAPFGDGLRVKNYLVHVHLPKLVAEHVVALDEDRDTVTAGEHFETYAQVLRLIDQLPNGE